MENTASDLKTSMDQLMKNQNLANSSASSLKPNQLIQAVKAVCAFLGNIETLEIQGICDKLIRSCAKFNQNLGTEDGKPEIMNDVRTKNNKPIKSIINE